MTTDNFTVGARGPWVICDPMSKPMNGAELPQPQRRLGLPTLCHFLGFVISHPTTRMELDSLTCYRFAPLCSRPFGRDSQHDRLRY